MFRSRQRIEEGCGNSNKNDPAIVGTAKVDDKRYQVRIRTVRTLPARNCSPLRSPRKARPVPDATATKHRSRSPVTSSSTWRMRSSTSSSPISNQMSLDTTSRKGSRPDQVSHGSSMLTGKSFDPCAPIFSDEAGEGVARHKNANPYMPPLWIPPTRSNVEILAEIEEMVASFQFEGLEQVVISTRRTDDGDMSDLSSADGVSVPDSLCAEYLTKRGLRGYLEEAPTEPHHEDHKQSLTGEPNLDAPLSILPSRRQNPMLSRMVSTDLSDENDKFEALATVHLNINAQSPYCILQQQ